MSESCSRVAGRVVSKILSYHRNKKKELDRFHSLFDSKIDIGQELRNFIKILADTLLERNQLEFINILHSSLIVESAKPHQSKTKLASRKSTLEQSSVFNLTNLGQFEAKDNRYERFAEKFFIQVSYRFVLALKNPSVDFSRRLLVYCLEILYQQRARKMDREGFRWELHHEAHYADLKRMVTDIIRVLSSKSTTGFFHQVFMHLLLPMSEQKTYPMLLELSTGLKVDPETSGKLYDLLWQIYLEDEEIIPTLPSERHNLGDRDLSALQLGRLPHKTAIQRIQSESIEQIPIFLGNVFTNSPSLFNDNLLETLVKITLRDVEQGKHRSASAFLLIVLTYSVHQEEFLKHLSSPVLDDVLNDYSNFGVLKHSVNFLLRRGGRPYVEKFVKKFFKQVATYADVDSIQEYAETMKILFDWDSLSTLSMLIESFPKLPRIISICLLDQYLENSSLTDELDIILRGKCESFAEKIFTDLAPKKSSLSPDESILLIYTIKLIPKILPFRGGGFAMYLYELAFSRNQILAHEAKFAIRRTLRIEPGIRSFVFEQFATSSLREYGKGTRVLKNLQLLIDLIIDWKSMISLEMHSGDIRGVLKVHPDDKILNIFSDFNIEMVEFFAFACLINPENSKIRKKGYDLLLLCDELSSQFDASGERTRKRKILPPDKFPLTNKLQEQNLKRRAGLKRRSSSSVQENRRSLYSLLREIHIDINSCVPGPDTPVPLSLCHMTNREDFIFGRMEDFVGYLLRHGIVSAGDVNVFKEIRVRTFSFDEFVHLGGQDVLFKALYPQFFIKCLDSVRKSKVLTEGLSDAFLKRLQSSSGFDFAIAASYVRLIPDNFSYYFSLVSECLPDESLVPDILGYVAPSNFLGALSIVEEMGSDATLLGFCDNYVKGNWYVASITELDPILRIQKRFASEKMDLDSDETREKFVSLTISLSYKMKEHSALLSTNTRELTYAKIMPYASAKTFYENYLVMLLTHSKGFSTDTFQRDLPPLIVSLLGERNMNFLIGMQMLNTLMKAYPSYLYQAILQFHFGRKQNTLFSDVDDDPIYFFFSYKMLDIYNRYDISELIPESKKSEVVSLLLLYATSADLSVRMQARELFSVFSRKSLNNPNVKHLRTFGLRFMAPEDQSQLAEFLSIHLGLTEIQETIAILVSTPVLHQFIVPFLRMMFKMNEGIDYQSDIFRYFLENNVVEPGVWLLLSKSMPKRSGVIRFLVNGYKDGTYPAGIIREALSAYGVRAAKFFFKKIPKSLDKMVPHLRSVVDLLSEPVITSVVSKGVGVNTLRMVMYSVIFVNDKSLGKKAEDNIRAIIGALYEQDVESPLFFESIDAALGALSISDGSYSVDDIQALFKSLLGVLGYFDIGVSDVVKEFSLLLGTRSVPSSPQQVEFVESVLRIASVDILQGLLVKHILNSVSYYINLYQYQKQGWIEKLNQTTQVQLLDDFIAWRTMFEKSERLIIQHSRVLTGIRDGMVFWSALLFLQSTDTELVRHCLFEHLGKFASGSSLDLEASKPSSINPSISPLYFLNRSFQTKGIQYEGVLSLLTDLVVQPWVLDSLLTGDAQNVVCEVVNLLVLCLPFLVNSLRYSGKNQVSSMLIVVLEKLQGVIPGGLWKRFGELESLLRKISFSKGKPGMFYQNITILISDVMKETLGESFFGELFGNWIRTTIAHSGEEYAVSIFLDLLYDLSEGFEIFTGISDSDLETFINLGTAQLEKKLVTRDDIALSVLLRKKVGKILSVQVQGGKKVPFNYVLKSNVSLFADFESDILDKILLFPIF